MEDITTIGEILEFAIAREAEAVNLYMAMARRVTDPSMVKFFEDLVSEELEHKSRLELEVMKEGLVARTVGVVPETSADDPPVSPDQVAKEMIYPDALTLAILKERRSFRQRNLYGCSIYGYYSAQPHEKAECCPDGTFRGQWLRRPASTRGGGRSPCR